MTERQQRARRLCTSLDHWARSREYWRLERDGEDPEGDNFRHRAASAAFAESAYEQTVQTLVDLVEEDR